MPARISTPLIIPATRLTTGKMESGGLFPVTSARMNATPAKGTYFVRSIKALHWRLRPIFFEKSGLRAASSLIRVGSD
jgi:hypothetical protein